jgi:hypothetical protein
MSEQEQAIVLARLVSTLLEVVGTLYRVAQSSSDMCVGSLVHMGDEILAMSDYLGQVSQRVAEVSHV